MTCLEKSREFYFFDNYRLNFIRKRNLACLLRSYYSLLRRLKSDFQNIKLVSGFAYILDQSFAETSFFC